MFDPEKFLLKHSAIILCGIILIPAAGQTREPGSPNGSQLSMADAIALALTNEPGLARLSAERDAERAAATADAQLPDPVVTLGALNLPVDTFETDQEAMTQLKIGFRQDIPRGDTLALKRRQRETQAQQLTSLHGARELRISTLR